MEKEISKDRFEELNKMINFLESIKNITRNFFSYAEGAVEGLDVYCATSNAPLMRLTKDNYKNKFYMKEF